MWWFLLLQVVCGVLVDPLPKPQSIEWSGGQKVFNPFLQLKGDDQDKLVFRQFYQMLETVEQLKWYPQATDGPTKTYDPVPTGPPSNLTTRSTVESLQVLNVYLDNLNVPLQYGVNESYTLAIDSEITIQASTVWGALHALKTLQQLIIYENGAFYIEGSVAVVDEPNYPHRGVLIDSGRNFLTLDVIREQIDLMSLAKLNVLHWHLIDTHSWPIELKSHPNVLDGAYSEDERYSQLDVKAIIQYAYERGIRVIPEVDLPGHANAGWDSIDPELVACKNAWWGDVAAEPPGGQLDIAYENTYNIVEDVFDELNGLFTDNFFHVGHDELNANCYNTSDNVWEWYQDNDGDFYDLVQYWVNKSYPIFTKDNKTKLIMWEDIITSENATINQDITLQVWLSSESVKDLTSKGFDVIVSAYEHYYLDCGYGGWVTNNTESAGSWCDPYKNWQNIYSYDFNANLTEPEQLHIKGGEVAIWGEMVDSSSLIQKVWSRAGAFAEVVWSGNKADDGSIRLYDMTQRMFNFREYVVALGHKVDALAPKYCWLNPHSCDAQLY